jgi:hypothetical protein
MRRVRSRWSKEETRVAMEQRLRAQTIPSRKQEGPSLDEWDYEEVSYDYEEDTSRLELRMCMLVLTTRTTSMF